MNEQRVEAINNVLISGDVPILHKKEDPSKFDLACSWTCRIPTVEI